MTTARQRYKDQPDMRAARKDMADLYKRVRRDNPAMARLLWHQQKLAIKLMVDNVLYGTGHESPLLPPEEK